MKPVLAFVAGVLVGAVIVAILLRSPTPTAARGERYWQERAESAESELAAARRQLDGLATQLQRLTDRFNELTARFEALQVAPTPPPAP